MWLKVADTRRLARRAHRAVSHRGGGGAKARPKRFYTVWSLHAAATLLPFKVQLHLLVLAARYVSTLFRERFRINPLAAGNMDFHALCALGDVSGVAAALNVDPALSGALDSNLWNGVHHATKHGHTDVLEALLGARRSNLALALALALVLALIPSPIPNLDQALAPLSTLGRITIAPPCTLRLARY